MKIVLFTIILSFAAVTSFAQIITYGVRGGINFSELPITGPMRQSIKNEQLTGFNIGAVAEIEYQQFSVEPGIFITTKGGKTSSTLVIPSINYNGTEHITIKANYFEVPVNFLYRLKISSLLSLHLGGGPYVGYSYSTTVNDQQQPTLNQPSNFTISLNNPDYGFNFEAGLKLDKRFIIDVDYGLGLRNVLGAPSKNKTLSLSVGFQFK